MDPWLRRSILAALIFLTVIPVRAQTLDWVATFDDLAAGRESPRSAALSPTGGLHILAEHSDGFVYFRVDADGQNVRETRFAVPYSPHFLGPVIDHSGGAYLAQYRYGNGSELDFAILRLAESDDQWTVGIYDDPDDRDNVPHELVIDALGNAIVAGASMLSSPDIRLLTVCFGPDARVRWVARHEDARLVRFEAYEGGGVRATTDADGNTYVAAHVTGAGSDTDTLLVKYDSHGQEIWVRRFDIDATNSQGFWPGVLIINGNGEIVVCGPSTMPRGFALARFDADGNDLGHTFTPLTSMSAKYVNGACVNPVDGGIFVAATVQPTGPFPDYDFALFRYGAAGELVYFSTFSESEQSLDMLRGVAVDAEGRAYLGGSTDDVGSDQDLWVVQVLSDGTAGWSVRHSTSESVASDAAAAFLLNPQGRLTLVAQGSDAHTGSDAVTVRMNTDGVVEAERHFNTTVRSSEWGMHGVVVADSGDLYMCGNSGQFPDSGALVTVKYDANGVEQWRQRVTEMGSSGFQLGLRGGQLPVVLGLVSADGSIDAQNVILIEYLPDGRENWRLEYDGPGSDFDTPIGMVQDVWGDMYIAIHSRVSGHYIQVLLKVDGSGRILWERFADGFGFGPLAVDAQGNVFLSGPGLTLAKYTTDGALDWIRWHESSPYCDEHAQAMAAGPGGSIIVAGETCADTSQGALAVMRFGPDGQLAWHVEDPNSAGRSTATCMAIDAHGEIYVSGVEIAGGYRTLVGRVSPQGQLRWLARHQLGTGSMASSVGISLDGVGHVYCAGSQSSQLDDPNYVLLRYDLDGNLDWRASFGLIEGAYDLAGALAIDTANYGAAYLCGQSNGGTTHGDFVTLRYGAAPAPCAAGGLCRLGDTDGDCRVGLGDLGAVLANFGVTNEASISPSDGDLNFDGVTDLADLARVLSAFGSDCR